ncbi:MAG: PAS domain-containing protein [Acidimicrobiales bacterium]
MHRADGASPAITEDTALDLVRSVLGAIGKGIVLANGDGEVLYRNDAADWIGLHAPGLTDAVLACIVRTAMCDGETSETFELLEGPKRTLVITARPVGPNDRILGAVAVIEDVTERRRLEAIRRDFRCQHQPRVEDARRGSGVACRDAGR